MNENFPCGCEWSYGQFFPCDAHRDARCKLCGQRPHECRCPIDHQPSGEQPQEWPR